MVLGDGDGLVVSPFAFNQVVSGLNTATSNSFPDNLQLLFVCSEVPSSPGTTEGLDIQINEWNGEKMNLDEVKRIKKTGAVGLWSLVLLASILHLTTLDKVFNSCWYLSGMVNIRGLLIFSSR